MWRGLGSMNKGPNATIRLVRRQNHAGTTVSWTTVQREKSSHAYKLSSNVQTACSTDSLNNCPKHSILRFSSFALKIYLWLKMCQHNLPCSIVYAHCLLPGRAFASLYVLLFLEKEAEIGGRDVDRIGMELPIWYLKGSQVEVSKFWCIYVMNISFYPSKQCRPWWNAAVSGISSGSSL